MRMFAYGISYFRQPLEILDLILVTLGCCYYIPGQWLYSPAARFFVIGLRPWRLARYLNVVWVHISLCFFHMQYTRTRIHSAD